MDINIRRQDRSQTKAETGASSGDAVRTDTSASAALAEAVKSARETAKSVVQVSEVKAASRWSGASRFATQSVVALMLVGAGWSASYMGTLSNRSAIERLEDETARSQEILARLSSDLASLTNTAAAFKEVEHTSSITAKSEQTKLTDNIERLVISLQEPTRKLSSLEGRLDKMESQIMTTLAALSTKPAPSTAPAAPIAPPAPPVTEAAAREEAPAPKPAKNEPVDGWVLREVYKGAALVESRNRRLYEVMPGGILPGVGKVESIERRGARWVVLTDKGFIGAYR